MYAILGWSGGMLLQKMFRHYEMVSVAWPLRTFFTHNYSFIILILSHKVITGKITNLRGLKVLSKGTRENTHLFISLSRQRLRSCSQHWMESGRVLYTNQIAHYYVV